MIDFKDSEQKVKIVFSSNALRYYCTTVPGAAEAVRHPGGEHQLGHPVRGQQRQGRLPELYPTAAQVVTVCVG